VGLRVRLDVLQKTEKSFTCLYSNRGSSSPFPGLYINDAAHSFATRCSICNYNTICSVTVSLLFNDGEVNLTVYRPGEALRAPGG